MIAPSEMDAAACPFAQRAVIDLLYDGIFPTLQQRLLDMFRSAFQRQRDRVLERLTSEASIDTAQSGLFATAFDECADDVLQAMEQEFHDTAQEEYKSPLLQAVGALPKHELAAMAEALVSLTAFKARMSAGETETVGGPIDVAIISKGDGFIWVKRKDFIDSARDLVPDWQATLRGRSSRD